MNHRPERMGALLQETLGKMILRDIEVSGALLTITSVTPSKDLLYARVLVSVIPGKKSKEALALLNRERKTFQRKLVRTLNLKPIPEITFEIDHGQERAAGIEKALLEEDDGNNPKSAD